MSPFAYPRLFDGGRHGWEVWVYANCKHTVCGCCLDYRRAWTVYWSQRAAAFCPCKGPFDDPPPHIAECPLSDPSYPDDEVPF